MSIFPITPLVRKVQTLILATAIILMALFAIVLLSWHHYHPPQALSVSFDGYTNLLSGDRVAVFTVSNQCNITVKLWAVTYVESGSFEATNSPKNWVMDTVYNPDAYLKPGATERVLVRAVPPSGAWKLRVPWSWGVRARIHLLLRKFPYSTLPARWSVAPEYYASSEMIAQ